MKMTKILKSILACGLLLMSIGLAFGQTTDERKLELVVQTGHSETVSAVTFSPDGNILAAGDDEGHIKLWEVKSGSELRTLIGHSMNIMSVAFSPDGKYLASGGLDHIIKIWNVENGNEVATLKGHSSVITSVIFSPNGAQLASSSSDHTIKIWDVITYKEIKTLNGHSDSVETVIFIPNTNYLASGSSDKTIKIWNLESGRILKTLIGHLKTVNSIAVTNDDKKIISGSEDKTIKIWDLESGKSIKTLSGHKDEIQSIKLSPNGEFFASSGRDFKVIIWDTNTFDKIRSIQIGSNSIASISISSDSKIIATSNVYSSIDLWNAETGKWIKDLTGYFDYVNSVKSNLSGEYIAWLGKNYGLNLLDLRNNKRQILDEKASDIVFSPDGKTLAFISERFTLKLWDLENGKIINQVTNSSVIQSLSFFQDNKTIACLQYDGIFKLFSLNSLTELTTVKVNSTQTNKISVSLDNKIVAIGGKEKITLYNINNKHETDLSISSYIESIAFLNNSNTLLYGDSNNQITFWNNDSSEIKSLNKFDSNTISEISNNYPKFFEDYYHNICFLKDYILVNLDGTKFNLYKKENLKELSAQKLPIEFSTLTALNENAWAITSPDGRFDASEGALKLMHYSYGLEVINLEQLKEMYYEPGLLQKLLGFSKEPLRPIVPLKDVKLYPEIVSQTIEPNSTKLQIKLKNRGGGIGQVQVFVGSELGSKLAVEDARDAKLKQNPDVPEATLEVDLQGTGYLKGKPNTVTVVTSNYLKEIGKGNIQSRGSQIVWQAGGAEEEYKLPTLYAIVGGVSDYAGDNLKLRFAAKDAEDFSNALSLGAKKLFCDQTKPNCLDKVNITTLSTSGNAGTILPTKENFRTAFREVAAKAKPEDIVVIYLAGHGVSFGAGTDSYFYLTQEARTTSREDLAKVLATSAISSDELRDWLTPDTADPNDIFIKAMKQVVILDTCASGNAAGQLALTAKRELSSDQIRAVEFLKDKTGTFVLMASTADAPSYEASQFGQGLLTYSLLQAMKGAALDKGEYVDVQQLFAYAQKEVPQLAQNIGGVQRPIVSAPLGKTFVIGQMTDAEKKNLNLPSPKPLMLRPLLTNPETGDDDLKLIPALRKMLDAESSYEVTRRSGNGDPTLIYIDDDSFPGAIRLTGTYTVEGENVRVKAFLRQDGKTIAALPEIAAAKDKVSDELLKALQSEVKKIAKR